MHAITARPVHRLGGATALLLAVSLVLAGCKGEGDAQAKTPDKGPDAVPVETVPASRRAIAASYTGTAPLEPRADSQVVTALWADVEIAMELCSIKLCGAAGAFHP